MWRKQNRKFPLYFRLMGYVMMVVGIVLIVNGIKDYAEQSRQNDWLTTQATVTDVSSHVVRSHGSGNRSSTYYTLVYEYTVNGETYTGKSGQLSSPRLVGDVITVKYDPEAPEESTTALSPHTRDLVVLLVLGTAMAVAGFFLSGMPELFRNLLRKKHTEEPKESVPETDTGFDATAIAKIPAKQWVPRLGGLASCVRRRCPFREIFPHIKYRKPGRVSQCRRVCRICRCGLHGGSPRELGRRFPAEPLRVRVRKLPAAGPMQDGFRRQLPPLICRHDPPDYGRGDGEQHPFPSGLCR